MSATDLRPHDGLTDPRPVISLLPGPRATGALLVTAAVAEVVEQLLSPLTGGDTRQDLADISAHQGQFVVSVLIGMAATLMYAPGFLGLARTCAPRSPRLAVVAGWVAVASMGGFLAVRLGQAVELAGVHAGLAHATLARAVDDAGANPIGAVVLVLFLGGALVGTVLLAVVGWRARLPRPACVALGLFQLLDLFLPSQPVPWSHLVLLGALGWVAVGLWRRTP